MTRAAVILFFAVWLALGYAMYPTRGLDSYLHLDPAQVRFNSAKPVRLSLDAYQKRRAKRAHKKIRAERTKTAPRPDYRIQEAPPKPIIPKPVPRETDFARILPWPKPVIHGTTSERIETTYRALDWPVLSKTIERKPNKPIPSIGWAAFGMGMIFLIGCYCIVRSPQVERPKQSKRYRVEPIILSRNNVVRMTFGKRKIA